MSPLSNANCYKLVNVIQEIVSEKIRRLCVTNQKSAYSVHRQRSDLGKKIDRVLQPVFTSGKISEDLKITETKPSLVNQPNVVYEYQCDSCDSNYRGYTSRHLLLRIEEHKYSVIGKHLSDKHNQRPTNLYEKFTTLKKCRGKFACLIYEMLLLRKKKPTLNTQNDSSETVYLTFSHSFVYSRLIYCNEYFLTYYFQYNNVH